MTAAEYEEITNRLMAEYFTPLYQVIGASAAIMVAIFAYFMIVHPFTKRDR